MKATIWHNPACGTSRNALAILRETGGLELQVVEYLKHPPTREQRAALYGRASMTPRDGLRMKSSPAADLYAELGLASANDNAILDAMAAHPALIERPLVETEKGVRLCRPVERVRDIL